MIDVGHNSAVEKANNFSESSSRICGPGLERPSHVGLLRLQRLLQLLRRRPLLARNQVRPLTSVLRLGICETFALITITNSSSSAAPPERSSLILKGSVLKLETALSGTLYYFRLGQKIELVRWEGRAVMSRLCSKANRFQSRFFGCFSTIWNQS